MTLAEFLLARIAEDEKRVYDADGDGEYRIAWLTFRHPDGSMRYTRLASDHNDDYWVSGGELAEAYSTVRIVYDAARVLAECESKRILVNSWTEQAARAPEDDWGDSMADTWIADGARYYMRILAAPYAKHPDFQREWIA